MGSQQGVVGQSLIKDLLRADEAEGVADGGEGVAADGEGGVAEVLEEGDLVEAAAVGRHEGFGAGEVGVAEDVEVGVWGCLGEAGGCSELGEGVEVEDVGGGGRHGCAGAWAGLLMAESAERLDAAGKLAGVGAGGRRSVRTREPSVGPWPIWAC